MITRRTLVAAMLVLVVSGAVGALALADARGRGAANASAARRASGRTSSIDPALIRGLDLSRTRRVGDRIHVPLPSGNEAVLTVDRELEAHIRRTLSSYAVPYGALVAIEPATGRVLAYVSHSSANPAAGDLAIDATPPAASVFKIITGAALVDAGQGPDTRVCYSGGFDRLDARDLDDDRVRDQWCATLAEAMGGSINAIFAKLADRHVPRATLERYATGFGFGSPIPFDLPTTAGAAELPTERLEYARTAAGFWHMHMSPLQGALIAATIAADGRMPRPRLVERVVDPSGRVVATSEPSVLRTVVSPETAHAVNAMMRRTVTQGTSRRTFHDPHGVPFLPGIEVAGKTGTLTGARPYRGYTWWVGFAPADNPRIAIAALVVNTPTWRIKANFLALSTLRYHFVERPGAAALRPTASTPASGSPSAAGSESASSAATPAHTD